MPVKEDKPALSLGSRLMVVLLNLLALAWIVLIHASGHTDWGRKGTDWLFHAHPALSNPFLALLSFLLMRRSFRRYGETGQWAHLGMAILLGAGSLFFLVSFLDLVLPLWGPG